MIHHFHSCQIFTSSLPSTSHPIHWLLCTRCWSRADRMLTACGSCAYHIWRSCSDRCESADRVWITRGSYADRARIMCLSYAQITYRSYTCTAHVIDAITCFQLLIITTDCQQSAIKSQYIYYTFIPMWMRGIRCGVHGTVISLSAFLRVLLILINSVSARAESMRIIVSCVICVCVHWVNKYCRLTCDPAAARAESTLPVVSHANPAAARTKSAFFQIYKRNSIPQTVWTVHVKIVTELQSLILILLSRSCMVTELRSVILYFRMDFTCKSRK